MHCCHDHCGRLELRGGPEKRSAIKQQRDSAVNAEAHVRAMRCKKDAHLGGSVFGRVETQKSWMVKKPKIHDCYGVLEDIAWIWRVLGLFPMTVRVSMGMKKYEINKFYAVLSCTIYIVCAIQISYGLITFRKEDTNIVNTNLTIRTVTNLACLFVSNVWRIFRHNELSTSIESMAAQDVVLEKMSCRLNHESSSKIIRVYVRTTMLIVVLLVAYDIYATGQTSLNSQVKWVLWSTPQVIQTIDLTIFVALVGLLGSEFRALNKKINAVVLRANASSPKTVVTSDVCAEKLRIIAKTHYSLCAVGKRINRFFDLDMIISVITDFMILSTSLYYIFVEVQREANTDYIRVGMYVQWEILHSVPIIIIVLICNWTSQQGILAGKLIHEVRVDKTDSRLYETLRSFSLQLHHQNLEFNAGGLFPLNPTLLQSIVGNITTYLVILIQFQPKLD